MIKNVLLLGSVLLGGCAAGSYCEGSQKYEDAGSVPVIQPADGLQFKESSTALKIPPAPETRVPYGENYVDDKGKDAMRCLDQPPVLPPPKPDGEAPAAAPAQPG